MSAHLSPIVSEFETEEQAASYDHWFRTKVQEAMNSTKPKLAHDEAMSKVRAELEKRRKARADRPLV
ncbi:type II toxin-antitoxin system RelB family antitoxin [Pseudomonas saliphila]|uniref:type II toxin-antitoxin system RelB family antitoxin n=1 Tax=Pseudomonas saliphila TaxID=2586906 RepID=UPI0012384A90|nr:stability determinant [Pseudomonas saliphila]